MSSSYYDCSAIDRLPYKGTEILALTVLFLLIVVSVTVTFLDVACKQLWPAFLDPAVADAVARLQRLFPNLGKNLSAEEAREQHTIVPSSYSSSSSPIAYNRLLTQASYIATPSTDEDMITMLANNSAWSAVSDYCSASTRGYAMLSLFLSSTGMITGFAFCHNSLTQPVVFATWWSLLALLGYILVFCTALVMDATGSNICGFRRCNIFTFTSLPYDNPSASKVLKLHTFGIGAFCLLPTVVHVVIALMNPLPNKSETLSLAVLTIVVGVLYGSASKLPWTRGDAVAGKKWSILFEILAVLCAILSFLEYELYSTMLCAGHVEKFQALLLFGLFGPFALMARHQAGAPGRVKAEPSVMLMLDDVCVATFGPCPAGEFNNSTEKLPHI